MRAYDVVLFLVAFNAAFWIMSGLSIFGEVAPGGRLLEIPGLLLVGTLVAAIMGASITVLGTQVIRPVGVAVLAFSAFYGVMLTNAMSILYEFHISGPAGETIQVIPSVVIVAISLFSSMIFAAALLQMATGGWRPHR